MKKSNFPILCAIGAIAVSTAAFSASAQKISEPQKMKTTTKTLRGQTYFLERIALMPGAKLHVSLVGRIAGAEYLPLATTIVSARNGATPFALSVPADSIPAGPYRLQAWIIADGRLFMEGRDAQTTVKSLDESARIRLKIVAAPQNIDGIGDGKPLAATGEVQAAPATLLRGSVSKLDRRAISPDARLEIQLSDISLADAPSKLVVGQTINLDGAQLPRQFELKLAPDDLQPRRRYSLSAKLFEANQLTYITDTINEVSPENLGKLFELRLRSARP